MAKTGLSYYQAETDRFQDIKVKRLKKRYGCEGYAVYQYIQNEIYRVEGCYIRFTDDQLFDVSEYWGIEEQRVEKIIEYCTEVELFDTITWHTNHVLTSVDIQQRYLEICRRAKKKIVIPEDIRLVEIQDVASGVTGAPLPLFSGQEIETKTGKTVYGSPKLDTGKQTATDIGKETVITAGISSGVIIPQSSAEIPETPRNSAEKRHKEKESKEKYPPPLSPAGGNGGCGNNLFSKDSNTDGIERNFEGLTNRLNRLFIPPDEFNTICQLSNNGEIGHPIWTIIQAAERGGARLHSPGKYIISELKKAIKK